MVKAFGLIPTRFMPSWKSHWGVRKQELFAPFSSKYDRALKGDAELTALEAEGKALFFDKTRTNCSNCHQSSEANSAKETFTNYRYFNIGVPSNQELIKHNKLAADFVDNGLLDNPMVKGDEKQKVNLKCQLYVTLVSLHLICITVFSAI